MDTAAAQEAFEGLTNSLNRLKSIRGQVIDSYNRLAQSTADAKEFRIMLGEFNERRKEWDLALKEFTELQKQFTALAHETMVNIRTAVQSRRIIH